MSNVELQNITKHFPAVTALNDVSFFIKESEFYVLLGPTGAGKTTTLRVIAGLTKQDEGSVLFDNKPVDDLAPADRNIALVFQQYSLYPTMTVYNNLAFPLRSPLHRFPEVEIRKQVTEAAEKLRISHLLDRKTAHLSGGEMQRVAIGRAIVRRPRILLMDEPLSNLDAKLRESLRIELQHLQKTQGSTMLFVTHDQIEALTMADRIAVLNEGQIIQIGNSEDIYDRPTNTFVAQLVGTPRINLLPAHQENHTVYIKDSTLHIPKQEAVPLPSDFIVGVRPEDIILDPIGKFIGELVLTEPLGVETILHIKSGSRILLSIIPGITSSKIGDHVPFSVNPQRLHYFSTDGNRI